MFREISIENYDNDDDKFKNIPIEKVNKQQNTNSNLIDGIDSIFGNSSNNFGNTNVVNTNTNNTGNKVGGIDIGDLLGAFGSVNYFLINFFRALDNLMVQNWIQEITLLIVWMVYLITEMLTLISLVNINIFI